MTEQVTIQSLVESQANREWPAGEVHYEACHLCGYLVWASTKKDAPRKVVVGSLRYPCPRCQEVAMRSPEVYNWIISVLRYQELKKLETGDEVG